MKSIKILGILFAIISAIGVCFLFNACEETWSGKIENFDAYQQGDVIVLSWSYSGDTPGCGAYIYRNDESLDVPQIQEGDNCMYVDEAPVEGMNLYTIEYKEPYYCETYASASTTVYFTKDSNNGNGNNNGGNNDDTGNNNDNNLTSPSNVNAYVDGNRVKVTWSSVSGANGYKIYRASSSNGYFEKIGDSNSTSYYDNYPMDGTNYYRIKAYNSSSESEYSSYAYCSYAKPEEVKKPSAPTGVTAEFAGSTANPQVYITWNEVENATSYKVYRATSANGYYSQIGYETDYTRLYDYEPRSGANYYKVKAINSAGESEYSSYAKCNYDANAYSPCPPTLTLRKSGSNLRLSWTVSTAQGCGKPTSYEVKVYEPSINDWWSKATLSANETSYTLPNYMLYSEDGYVKIGVLVTNDYGTASNVAVWDVKNDKQL